MPYNIFTAQWFSPDLIIKYITRQHYFPYESLPYTKVFNICFCADSTFQLLDLLTKYLYRHSQCFKTWDRKYLAPAAQVVEHSVCIRRLECEANSPRIEIFSKKFRHFPKTSIYIWSRPFFYRSHTCVCVCVCDEMKFLQETVALLSALIEQFPLHLFMLYLSKSSHRQVSSFYHL